MPHVYYFKPPLKSTAKAGPLLRFRSEAALEILTDEPSRISSRVHPQSESPYASSTQIQNLLDLLTFGIRPRTFQDASVMLAIGLLPQHNYQWGTSGMRFALDPEHVHASDEPMRPSVLLEHSQRERTGSVHIAVSDELAVLAVCLLRELGYTSYLSVVESHTMLGGYGIAGALVLDGEQVFNLVIAGSHPNAQKLIVFNDSEALTVLGLLRLRNRVQQLRLDIKSDSFDEAHHQGRFAMLMHGMAELLSIDHPLRPAIEMQLLKLSRLLPSKMQA